MSRPMGIIANNTPVSFKKGDDVVFETLVTVGCLIQESPTIDALRPALAKLNASGQEDAKENWTSVKIGQKEFSREEAREMLAPKSRPRKRPQGPRR